MGSKTSKEQGGQRSSAEEPSPEPKAPLVTPWRDIGKKGQPMEWNEETEEQLRAQCLRSQLKLKKGQRVKILMLGSTGSGKSSFVNSLYNALMDRVAPWTYAASSTETVTRTLFSPRIQINNQIPWFKIVDAPGVLDSADKYFTDFVTMAIDGKIKEGVEVPQEGIQTNLPYLVQNPGVLDSPCLVVFIVKAGGYIPDGVLKRKFQIVKDRASVNKIKIAMVLTKADILSQGEKYPLKGKDMKYLYHSEAAQEAVKIAASETGVPENQIFPITNYTDQTETGIEMNIAVLYTLSKLLNFAEAEANNRIVEDDVETTGAEEKGNTCRLS